jgi:hypothetical protein
MFEDSTLNCLVSFGAIVVVVIILLALEQLWLAIRPTLLTPPRNWPKKNKYQEANKLFEKIILWPTKLGFAGDVLIINLWLVTFLLMPFMMVIALPIWLFNGLPNHWFWYRLSQRRR